MIRALTLRSSAPPRHLHTFYIPARIDALDGDFFAVMLLSDFDSLKGISNISALMLQSSASPRHSAF